MQFWFYYRFLIVYKMYVCKCKGLSFFLKKKTSHIFSFLLILIVVQLSETNSFFVSLCCPVINWCLVQSATPPSPWHSSQRPQKQRKWWQRMNLRKFRLVSPFCTNVATENMAILKAVPQIVLTFLHYERQRSHQAGTSGDPHEELLFKSTYGKN